MCKLNHFSSYYVAQSDGTYGNYRGRGERRKVTVRFVAHQLNAWICCVAMFNYKQSQPLQLQVGGGGLVVQGSAHLSAPSGCLVAGWLVVK